MHGFAYRHGSLHCEDVNLQTLADEHGTPRYVYSATPIRDHYRRLDPALGSIDHEGAYGVRASSNLRIQRVHGLPHPSPLPDCDELSRVEGEGANANESGSG